MKLFTSFTRTFKRFVNGTYSFDDLCAGSYTNPQVIFSFGCHREHIFRNDGKVPMEVTWPDRDASYDDVLFESLAEQRQTQWQQFLNILDAAERDGRIIWSASRAVNLLVKSSDIEVME